MRRIMIEAFGIDMKNQAIRVLHEMRYGFR